MPTTRLFAQVAEFARHSGAAHAPPMDPAFVIADQSRHRTFSRAAVCALAVGLSLLVQAPAEGVQLIGAYITSLAQQTCCIRPQDEIWLVSTRAEGRRADPCSCSTPCLCYFQYCCASDCWQRRSAAEFFAGQDPDSITTVFVHGNRQRRRNVLNRGFQSYCLLRCCVPCERRLRHVVWEWPSMPVPCRTALVRDGRVKLRRIPSQSYFLGWWLSQFCPNTQVRMVGHSYGANVMAGALHLMAGGKLDCRCLPPAPHGQRVRPRAVFWAAATQSEWLCRGQPHGCALAATECCFNMFSQQDLVLRRLGRVMRVSHRCPILGLDGSACCCANLREMDVTCEVGRRHGVDFYFQSCRVMVCTRAFLQLQ